MGGCTSRGWTSTRLEGPSRPREAPSLQGSPPKLVCLVEERHKRESPNKARYRNLTHDESCADEFDRRHPDWAAHAEEKDVHETGRALFSEAQ